MADRLLKDPHWQTVDSCIADYVTYPDGLAKATDVFNFQRVKYMHTLIFCVFFCIGLFYKSVFYGHFAHCPIHIVV